MFMLTSQGFPWPLTYFFSVLLPFHSSLPVCLPKNRKNAFNLFFQCNLKWFPSLKRAFQSSNTYLMFNISFWWTRAAPRQERKNINGSKKSPNIFTRKYDFQWKCDLKKTTSKATKVEKIIWKFVKAVKQLAEDIFPRCTMTHTTAGIQNQYFSSLSCTGFTVTLPVGYFFFHFISHSFCGLKSSKAQFIQTDMQISLQFIACS